MNWKICALLVKKLSKGFFELSHCSFISNSLAVILRTIKNWYGGEDNKWIFQVKVISMVIKFQMVASHAYKQWLCSNKNRYIDTYSVPNFVSSILCIDFRHSCFKKNLINSHIRRIRLDTNQSFIIVGNTDAVVAQLTLLLFVVAVVLSTFKFKIQGQ